MEFSYNNKIYHMEKVKCMNCGWYDKPINLKKISLNYKNLYYDTCPSCGSSHI